MDPTPSHKDSPYLTIPELAAYLKHSPHTIRAWHKRGKLPLPYKPFGKLLWHRDEIDRWVENSREKRPVHPLDALQLDRVLLPGGRK